MVGKREYRLKIEAYSPETMPMKRLVEYLSDLSVLFGEEASVHLIGIDSSSTCAVLMIDSEADSKVLDRVAKALDKAGPEDAMQAISNINSRLCRDKASAKIVNGDLDHVIDFPGIQGAKPLEWPSINQSSELYGIPIAVGGTSDLVPVHLIDGDTEYTLLAERTKAKGIAAHLFTSTIRVTGRGNWRKIPNGHWHLERFVIDDYELVNNATLSQALNGLQGINAKWKQLEDPLCALQEIRTGFDGSS